MTGTYSHPLVLLSVVIAIAASFVALDLAARTTAAHGRARPAWLLDHPEHDELSGRDREDDHLDDELS